MESSPDIKGGAGSATKSFMDNLLGLLRIKVKKGINLAVRDVRTSDPYCVIKMGKKQVPLFLFYVYTYIEILN